MRNACQENLEKYKDPAGYDVLYNGYVEDLAYIVETASSTDGPVIELACGTGRLAIPMASRGYRVIGVDIHEGMLALARYKAEQEKLDIAFYRQDCTKLDLDLKAPLIYMTGNSFQHFLMNDSQDAMFESVKRHLQPHGHFIFDTRNPILGELAEVYEHTMQKKDGSAVRMEMEKEVYDPVTQILHCTTVIETVEKGEVARVEKSSISLRYTYPQELLRLIEEHDFELVSLFGDWKKAAFSKDSTSMAVHLSLIHI